MAKLSPGYSLPKAPKYQELPTAKPRAARSGPERVELRVQLEVVTPILGGSHQTRAIDDVDVIRAPSVRGHLRFWWRALYAAQYANADALYQRESALWGRAATDHGGRSAVEVRVSVERVGSTDAADGKTYDTKHYNLSAIIAVGYKVNSERAVQFRKWATRVVEEFTIKGFAMDDERLKRGGSVLSDRYFEEQLQRIREIRLSERKFYQKITDIYATSVDYDVTAQATKRFFASVQNKLHGAIHGQTAAESSSTAPTRPRSTWASTPGPTRLTARSRSSM